jgi:hypothetical protein
MTKLVLALTACALALAAAASAASGGAKAVRFTLYSANVRGKDTPLLVRGRGAIAAVGTAVAKDESKSTTVPLTFTFPNGKLYVQSVDPFRWVPDLATCTATVTSHGTWTVTGGTGAYANARGRGTFVESGAGIGVRDAKGRCRQQFALNYVAAEMSGSLSAG